MPSAELSSAWVALVVGLLCGAIGGLTLSRPQSVPLWKRARGRIDARRFGVGQLFLAVFFLLEAVPRLADAPDIVVGVISVLALVPLAVAVTLHLRAQSPRP